MIMCLILQNSCQYRQPGIEVEGCHDDPAPKTDSTLQGLSIECAWKDAGRWLLIDDLHHGLSSVRSGRHHDFIFFLFPGAGPLGRLNHTPKRKIISTCILYDAPNEGLFGQIQGKNSSYHLCTHFNLSSAWNGGFSLLTSRTNYLAPKSDLLLESRLVTVTVASMHQVSLLIIRRTEGNHRLFQTKKALRCVVWWSEQEFTVIAVYIILIMTGVLNYTHYFQRHWARPVDRRDHEQNPQNVTGLLKRRSILLLDRTSIAHLKRIETHLHRTFNTLEKHLKRTRFLWWGKNLKKQRRKLCNRTGKGFMTRVSKRRTFHFTFSV